VGWAVARLDPPKAIRQKKRARRLRIAPIEARVQRRSQVSRESRALGPACTRKRTDMKLAEAGRGDVAFLRCETGSTYVEAGYEPATA